MNEMGESVSLEELIRHLEEHLQQRDVRHSAQAVAELLADDSVEYGSSGRVFDKPTIIAALQHESPAEISLTDYQARILAPDIVLVTYRAVQSLAAPAHTKQSLRSSI